MPFLPRTMVSLELPIKRSWHIGTVAFNNIEEKSMLE